MNFCAKASAGGLVQVLFKMEQQDDARGEKEGEINPLDLENDGSEPSGSNEMILISDEEII